MDAADAGDGEIVQLSGPVTLYESAEVRETLLAAVASGRDLVVDLETSGPWDLAGLQLLVAASASIGRAGRSLRFASVPKGCREIAERCGLGGWLGERADSFL